MARLSYDFYNRDTVEVARALLGKIVVRCPEGGPLLAGRLTETEAYIGRCDRACHAYGYRRTPRTATLYLGPGHAYVYLIYGMYHCLNFVTEPEGEPAAVLIRGMEAVSGTDFMWRRRYGDRPDTPARRRNFLNGPGKVCQALCLTTAENGLPLSGDALFVCDAPADIGLPDLPPRREIVQAGPRIGIDYAGEARDFPWRFTLEPRD
ncbi:MAG: DNA-3-methyladenine glycosylase [Oscillibacter sp.]|nr:DNA-3-methyladenine glycosylase [Oscillibacter sp.]